VSDGAQDMSQRVTAVANRLRLVQADLADKDPKERQEYLAEEVERALSSLVPEQRKAFLEHLAERFPSWDSQVDVQIQQGAPGGATAADMRELADPNFLVARLVKVVQGLKDTERQVLAERLREANLVPASSGQWPAQTADAARSALQLSKGAGLDAGRVLDALMMLANFSVSLDQLIWRMWTTIAPRSDVRKPAPLRETVAKFVSGDQNVPRGQVTQDLEKLRQLTAALISAVSQVGRQFASRHLARFAPTEIEAAAGMEGGGFLTSKEVKCWRRYCELARALDEATIDSQIMESISEYAQSLIKGINR
jgi:hypothetical protein